MVNFSRSAKWSDWNMPDARTVNCRSKWDWLTGVRQLKTQHHHQHRHHHLFTIIHVTLTHLWKFVDRLHHRLRTYVIVWCKDRDFLWLLWPSTIMKGDTVYWGQRTLLATGRYICLHSLQLVAGYTSHVQRQTAKMGKLRGSQEVTD